VEKHVVSLTWMFGGSPVTVYNIGVLRTQADVAVIGGVSG